MPGFKEGFYAILITSLPPLLKLSRKDLGNYESILIIMIKIIIMIIIIIVIKNNDNTATTTTTTTTTTTYGSSQWYQ